MISPPITYTCLGYLTALPAQTELRTFSQSCFPWQEPAVSLCSGSAGTLPALGQLSSNRGEEQTPGHIPGAFSQLKTISSTPTWLLHPTALVHKSPWTFNSSLGASTLTSSNTWSLLGAVGRALFSCLWGLQSRLSLLLWICRHWASLGLWVVWEFQWERFTVEIKGSCLTSQTLMMIFSSISSWFKLYLDIFHREWISSPLLS